MIAFVIASTFICTPVAVWDGDGPIWCKEGPKIRLENVAAREMDGTCRNGHPCPKASGEAARDALVNLLGGPKGKLKSGHIRVQFTSIQCQQSGTSYGRIVAKCSLPDGRDLGKALIATGTVLPWE